MDDWREWLRHDYEVIGETADELAIVVVGEGWQRRVFLAQTTSDGEPWLTVSVPCVHGNIADALRVAGHVIVGGLALAGDRLVLRRGERLAGVTADALVELCEQLAAAAVRIDATLRRRRGAPSLFTHFAE